MPRSEFRDRRVAVAGAGVSGLAVARAVKALGGFPTVLDQSPGDQPRVMAAVDQLEAAGIDVVTGWHGRLDPTDHDLLVVSPGIPPHHPVFEDMEGQTIGEIEFAYRISEAPILAITGTNGKSTSTVMLWKILDGGGFGAQLCGNIAGSGYPEQVFTTAALNTSAEGCLVAEVSSAQLETVSTWRPRVATITNITDDHRDRYPNFNDYAAAKLNLFKNMGEGDTIIWNSDEPSVTRQMVEDASNGAKIIAFSPSGENLADGVTRRRGGTIWLSGQEVHKNDLPFLGEHNIANAMMAWEMACALVGEAHIGMFNGLMEFRSLENRMELLGTKNGVRIINNSMCTNPMAVVKSSQSLEGKHHLIMGGNTKNMDFSPLHDYLKSSTHKVYLFGPSPDGLRAMLGGGWPVFETLKEAFLAAANQATDGETVMLAPGCASASPYANFRERGAAFKEIAKEWLENDTNQTP